MGAVQNIDGGGGENHRHQVLRPQERTALGFYYFPFGVALIEAARACGTEHCAP